MSGVGKRARFASYQQQFLPRELPNLPQWQIAAYYGPARAVGGDFYDFIEMRDGRMRAGEIAPLKAFLEREAAS